MVACKGGKGVTELKGKYILTAGEAEGKKLDDATVKELASMLYLEFLDGGKVKAFGEEGTYKLDGKKLTISGVDKDGKKQEIELTVDGNKLIMIEKEGSSSTFEKK